MQMSDELRVFYKLILCVKLIATIINKHNKSSDNLDLQHSIDTAIITFKPIIK